MADRPILFSAPMVRAILAGRKTQTRRVVKAPSGPPHAMFTRGEVWGAHDGLTCARLTGPGGVSGGYSCPFGVSGDRLWVRETFRDFKGSGETLYRADFPSLETTRNWTPSIHMPRWASRITLEVTEVRVQRLHDISEADAEAEGADCDAIPGHPETCVVAPEAWHRQHFAELWCAINGRQSWDANPWVWAISFKRIEARHG